MNDRIPPQAAVAAAAECEKPRFDASRPASLKATIATNTNSGLGGASISQPAGGTGIQGWLSGCFQMLGNIYTKLSGTLTTTLATGTNAIGSVSVSNFPATQPVSGSVSVSNLPTTQAVSLAALPALTAGAAAIGTVGVTGNVSVTDASGAAFQGSSVITPGTAMIAGRSFAYVCTGAGNITITLPDASTMTFGIAASTDLQTLPFAVTLLTLGSGTAGTFWIVR